IDKYVFRELYNQTKNNAEQLSKKNKFFLKGRYQSGSSQEIQLQGLNIAQGSIRVLSGSTTLVEGTDYTVDYQLGRVRIVNPGILTSGNDITIRFEKADLFNFRQKTLYGTRLDYRIHRDFNIGGTFMHLRERPLITRVSFGDDPLFNTMWGLDVNYSKESRFLTKMVDALPVIQTKEPSSISVKAEVAELIPGTPPQIGKENANMFIDDFEGTETPYDLTRQPIKWILGSTPKDFFDVNQIASDPLSYNYKRAKLSWYNIDQTAFFQGGSQKPGNISDEELKNHYVRGIGPQEIYPQRSLQAGYSNEPTFDLAYFPAERGMYNYNTAIQADGTLPNPKENYAALTRAITFDTDFDNANIQYIEFWMMDPFITGKHGNLSVNQGDKIIDNGINPGGQIWFQLGSVSEDLMKDGRHAFENGLPPDGGETGAIRDVWGKVTTAPYLNNAFSNLGGARDNQDVGLDGLKSSEEVTQFQKFADAVSKNVTDPNKKDQILADISNDNFKYFLSVESKSILDRYSNYNGMEGNSSTNTVNGFIGSNTNNPDNEDLNQNNTVSDVEQYFEYKVNIKKGTNGKFDERTNGFVVGKIANTINDDEVNWYQIRIPIRTNPTRVNGISDFKSIRFLRMVMAGWEQPVVIRMAQFQMVGSLWRPLDSLSTDKGTIRAGEPRNVGKVQLSTVNVEENGTAYPGVTPYVVPPDFIRDRDNTSNLNRLQNEQSLRICVDNLAPGDVAPAYKLINLNFINSKKIKMFLHAESSTARDYEMEGFLRIGTDFDDNYYDIRVPLKLTPPGSTEPQIIWPAENDVDVPLEQLSFVKAERNKAGFPQNKIFSLQMDGKIISIRGNPDFTSTQVALIGIQNPVTNSRNNQMCIWADELRTSGVNKNPGWAAVGTLNAKLADLANVTATGSYKSPGFGAIDQKITARQQNKTYQYGAASNITMDKFIPGNTGIKVPLYVSYDKKIIKPEYDPLNPDTKLETSLATLQEEERAERSSIVIDRSTRRSISLNNLQKVKTGQNSKNHLWDIENFSLTLGYSDIHSSNFLTQRYFFKNYKAGVAYTFGGNPKSLEPLKGIKSESKYVQLITAFNFTPLPSNLSFRTDLDRRFAVTQLRGSNFNNNTVAPLYEKSFYLNRSYGLRWAFTRSFGMDYRANVSTIIDEPTGEINNDKVRTNDPNSITKKDSVMQNLQKLGRVKNFDQNFNFTYRTPLDKIPFLDWTQSDLNYSANYMWKAGALGFADSLGNQAQNNRTFTANGKMDLLKLYNKLKFLREVNSPLTQVEQEHNQKREQWKRQLENPSLKKSEKDSLQNLISRKYASELRPVRGAFQLLMILKNFNMTYERSEGTLLPGFTRKPTYFGLNDGDLAPGIPFILGDQSDRIKTEAAEKNWISTSKFQSSPFVRTKGTKITYRTSLEPFKQFRVQLEGRQEQTQTYNEFFRYDFNGQLVSQNPTRSGSFKTSFISALTAFTKDDPVTNKNQTFETFAQNRDIIQDRMNSNRPNGVGHYDTTSQEVVIPAFIAAYSGRDAGKVGLTAFPRIPLPNWRIDYGGLSSLEFVKRYFSSVNLNHSYTSNYNVGNYSSSLRYGTEKINSQGSVFDMPQGTDTNGRAVFIPAYVINQVSIQESFSPLLGINLKTKKNITFNIKYNRTRNLNLSTTNSQVMEMKNQDYSISVGYTKTGMKLPVKYKQRVIVLKNEITFRFDFTIRDNKTIQRRVNDINVLTQGSQQIQIKPTINYRINDRLSIQLYYDRTINIPRVSSSFKRTNTLFGIQIRFSLS
ncbi:MAG: cell surface protein SprA, partial [Opitutaceae bacterium]|nr:cell surface protein SprA [Cytophagales bacterium]